MRRIGRILKSWKTWSLVAIVLTAAGIFRWVIRSSEEGRHGFSFTPNKG